jgi:hypothetical protein
LWVRTVRWLLGSYSVTANQVTSGPLTSNTLSSVVQQQLSVSPWRETAVLHPQALVVKCLQLCSHGDAPLRNLLSSWVALRLGRVYGCLGWCEAVCIRDLSVLLSLSIQSVCCELACDASFFQASQRVCVSGFTLWMSRYCK